MQRLGSGGQGESEQMVMTTLEQLRQRLRSAIREIPDFPKPGILFRDLTPVLGDASLFAATVGALASRYAHERVDFIAAIEARGFLWAPALATQLGAGLIPIRKKGKLPWKTRAVEYELEYGTAVLEMHEDAVRPGAKVVVVDDLLATGGTALAAAQLVESFGGELVEIAFVVELWELRGRERLRPRPVFSFLKLPDH